MIHNVRVGRACLFRFSDLTQEATLTKNRQLMGQFFNFLRFFCVLDRNFHSNVSYFMNMSNVNEHLSYHDEK
jgi:hypothetical protein